MERESDTLIPDTNLVATTESLHASAHDFVKELQAPRAPATPSGKHLRRKGEERAQVDAETPADEENNRNEHDSERVDEKNSECATPDVTHRLAVDSIKADLSAAVSDIMAHQDKIPLVDRTSSEYYSYGTPLPRDNSMKMNVAAADEGDDESHALSVDTETKDEDVPLAIQTTPKLKKKASFHEDILEEIDDKSRSGGIKRQWTPISGGAGSNLSFSGNDGDKITMASPSSFLRPESGHTRLSSGGSSRGERVTSSRGSNRPVSREDVKKMEIPSFTELQRVGSPIRRVSSAAKSPIAQLIIEEGEGMDHDESSVTSLDSTDEALLGELRKGFTMASEKASTVVSGATLQQNIPVPAQEPIPVTEVSKEDGDLGSGVQVLSTGLNIDLSDFDFATGGVVEMGQNSGAVGIEGGGNWGNAPTGGGTSVAGMGIVSRGSEVPGGFSDAMAVRPRTNERPSSTQQKYMQMYNRDRGQTPLTAERENLEGLELDLGAQEPLSARSGDSLLTMSTIGSISIRSGLPAPGGAGAGRRHKKRVEMEEVPSKVSIIPFPFPSRPNMPHVDVGITNEKLTYKAIKKPFETKSDELHSEIREKIMRKQKRKARRAAKIAEFERRERERETLLLAEFTREQVNSAMTYFRTMCVKLSDHTIVTHSRDVKEKGGNYSPNQLEDDGTSNNNNNNTFDDLSTLDEEDLSESDQSSNLASNSRHGGSIMGKKRRMEARLKKRHDAKGNRGKAVGSGNNSNSNSHSHSRSNSKKNKGSGSSSKTSAVEFKTGRYAPESDGEIKLNELEAVIRKFKRAKATVEEEEYGRGLLLSLEWLLEELEMTPMEWFIMVDSRDGTQTGDEKLTYLELSRGVDMLCDELSDRMTRDLREKQQQDKITREKEIRVLDVQLKEAENIEKENRHNAHHGVHVVKAGKGEDSISASAGAAAAAAGNDGPSSSPLHVGKDEGSVASKATTASQEFAAGYRGHADRVQVPHWRRHDLQLLLKYLDPNGDGDVSVCEMKLAFKNLHLTLESQRIVEEAGPVLVRLIEYMVEKQLTVKEIFAIIDTDRSLSISCDELFDAMNRFFKREPTAAELAQRRAERMALAADLDSSGSLGSDDDFSLSQSYGAEGSIDLSISMTSSTTGSRGTRGWASMNSIAGSASVQSSVPSRFGPSKNSDMSSSWVPRGQLNSRGKHKFLKKSVSSTVLRPVKTRKQLKEEKDALERAQRSDTANTVNTANTSRQVTAESGRRRKRGGGVRSRAGTSASTDFESGGVSEKRVLNSDSVAAKEQLKGGRRGGTFAGSLPGLKLNGGGTLIPGGIAAGSGLAALHSASNSTSKKTRLANAKLQSKHKIILDSYSELFDRQYDTMRSQMLPEDPRK